MSSPDLPDPDATIAHTTLPPVPGGEGGEPPDDGPPTGGDGDREWYRNPKVIAAIAVGALLVGILAGWALLGGDGDDEAAAPSTTATTGSTTSTTAPATTTTGAPTPATTATTVEITDGTTAPGPGQGQGSPFGSAEQQDLDAARGRWADVQGASYVFGYSQDAEGLTERHCVSGTAGVPSSVTDVTGACGDGVVPDGIGVDDWFDTIQDAIDSGELVSVAYDPADGHPTSVVLSFVQGDGTAMTQDFLQFQ